MSIWSYNKELRRFYSTFDTIICSTSIVLIIRSNNKQYSVNYYSIIKQMVEGHLIISGWFWKFLTFTFILKFSRFVHY